MTPEQWDRIEAVFVRAVEVPPADRARVLAEACGDDDELLHDVESLLAEHDHDPVFLDHTPWDLVPIDVAATPDRIGSYRIIRLLGRGGMGQVFLAEREEPQFRQVVALKLVRRGLDTDDLLARFATERQILATLNHPNIARLYDVGATVDGLPYLVMEYVDGEPILEYCQVRQLSVAERVQLFQVVCGAVQHAHRNLVVHRDLKPGNILVTREGVPKLLDFGIAKVLGAETGSSETQVGVRVLTPDYAAPEQIRGGPVTTACDVYALGILLYEMLAGRHPYGNAGTSADREKAAVETEPVAPSVASALPRRAPLRRQLEGDLDAIILKALRKEPEARYASVLSMSEDLDRHRIGLPVNASPPSTVYRLRRFIGRNRLPVAATVALVSLMFVATIVTLVQARRIDEASARVAHERDKALQVTSFLLEMFGTTGPDQATGDSVTARQLLARQAAALTANVMPGGADLRAEMLNVLAQGYEKLGLLTDAEPLARQALQIRRELHGPTHPDLVVALNTLGWIRYGRADFEEADTLLREAVAVASSVFGAAGDVRFARALNDLGAVQEARGNYDDAAELYARSLVMRRAVQGEEHMGVAVTTSNLAVVHYRRGDLDAAAATAEDALARFRAILGPDHQRTMTVENNLAAMQSRRGDHQAAERSHREILERRRRLFGQRHPSTAFTMTAIANELVALGRNDEAEQLLMEAIDVQRESLGPRHPDMATTLRVLGHVKVQTGRHADALPDYELAMSIIRSVYGDEHRELLPLLRASAAARAATGDSAFATRLLQDADALENRVRLAR